VVASNTVHESPGEGASALATPPPATNATGATAVISANAVADFRHRSLLMTDIS
jgi:hypothetical protein